MDLSAHSMNAVFVLTPQSQRSFANMLVTLDKQFSLEERNYKTGVTTASIKPKA
jgi:hypothetical protein